MPDAADRELLLRWRDGDTEAGQALFERNFDAVHRFLQTKAPAEVLDDLVQTTFLGALEARERLRDDTRIRVFLLVVARRKLYSYYRTAMGGRMFDPAVSSILDLRTSPSSAAARDEIHAQLHLALDRLPVEQRMVLELRYFSDLKVSEVAEVLECPLGTAKTRLRAAKATLLRELEQDVGVERRDVLLRAGGLLADE